MKIYYEQSNVGKCKYIVNYHDGVSKHKDGSDFYDIAAFKTKKERDAFTKGLMEKGYLSEHYNHTTMNKKGSRSTVESWALSNLEPGKVFYSEKQDKDIQAIAGYYERKVKTERVAVVSDFGNYAVSATVLTKVTIL